MLPFQGGHQYPRISFGCATRATRFFFAEEVDKLELIVGESTDVQDCEYVELPLGGIISQSPAIVPVEIEGSVDADEKDIPEVPWPGTSLSESWWSFLYGYSPSTRFNQLRALVSRIVPWASFAGAHSF
jgi:hypothetical protein